MYNNDTRTMQLTYMVFYVDDFVNGDGTPAGGAKALPTQVGVISVWATPTAGKITNAASFRPAVGSSWYTPVGSVTQLTAGSAIVPTRGLKIPGNSYAVIYVYAYGQPRILRYAANPTEPAYDTRIAPGNLVTSSLELQARTRRGPQQSAAACHAPRQTDPSRDSPRTQSHPCSGPMRRSCRSIRGVRTACSIRLSMRASRSQPGCGHPTSTQGIPARDCQAGLAPGGR